MKERKFKLCGVLKKSDCIELIRNNLSFEELKSLINPNFNQLIRILNCMNKKELQYIVFNTEKLSIEKITNTIQKTALEEKNTINKNFSNNDNDSEEEDFLSDNVILHEEKLDTGKKPAEIISHENNVMNNIEVKKLDAEIISHENNSINNNEVQKLDTKNQTKIISHENNDEDININNEIINISNEKTEIQFNTEQLDKVYDIKQVKNILLKHNFTAEQIINYLKENANRILTKMKINVNYKKIFTKYSKENYNDIYELMSYISSLTPTTSRAFASRAFASRAFAC